MIKEYRKKTTIKAERFNGSPKQIAKYKVHVVGPTSWGDKPYFLLPTKEGDMKLNTGDWIATETGNEYQIIPDDIFRRTYEEVDDND